MARPLAAVAALVLALSPSAALAMTPAEFKAALTSAFSSGASAGPIDAAGQDETAVRLKKQVLYIQAGRDDTPDRYEKLVRGVAKGLGIVAPPAVEAVVKLYLGRTGQRVIAATPEELAARESIIADIAARNAARLKTAKRRIAMTGITTNVFRSSTDDLANGGTGNGGFAAFGDGGRDVRIAPTKPDIIEASMIDFGGAVKPVPAKLPTTRDLVVPKAAPVVAGAPAVTSLAFSFADLAPYFDLARGARAAADAVSGVIESGRKKLHQCYHFVKQALIDAGIIDAPAPEATGAFGLRADKASYFNADVVKHPEVLEKMGYRRVKGEEVGLSDATIPPPGSLLMYGAKCWFAKYKQAGHAEIVVTPDEYEEARREKPAFEIPPLGAGDLPTCYYDCKPRPLARVRQYASGANACLRVYVPVRKG